MPGRPYAGKVFAAIHAHLDDIPHFAAGLCAKLMAEGYTGYMIRTTNDEKCGGHSIAENVLSNEQDHARMARALGFKDTFNFYYRNHLMNEISATELRGRLILIFRMLKVDTVDAALDGYLREHTFSVQFSSPGNREHRITPTTLPVARSTASPAA